MIYYSSLVWPVVLQETNENLQGESPTCKIIGRVMQGLSQADVVSLSAQPGRYWSAATGEIGDAFYSLL